MIKNRSLKLWSLAVLVFLFTANNLLAQQIKKEFAPINTAVPSLSIAPDARGGGMGDNGVARSPMSIRNTGTRPSMYSITVRQVFLFLIRLGYVNGKRCSLSEFIRILQARK